MKITQRQLRQIIRESLENYLLNEEEMIPQQSENITIVDLSIERVNILDGEGNVRKFVAKTRRNALCDWKTASKKKGDTTIKDGTIEGVVDLGQLAKAIGKTGKIQRQAVSRYFQEAFGYFSINGNVVSMSENDIAFDQENGLKIKPENKIVGVKVERITLETTGLAGLEQYNNVTLPKLNVPTQQATPTEPQQPEPQQEPEMESEPSDFGQSLAEQGFKLVDGNKIYTSDKQWVATYYDSNNSVMTFADLANAPFVPELKAACAKAGVRFVEQ